MQNEGNLAFSTVDMDVGRAQITAMAVAAAVAATAVVTAPRGVVGEHAVVDVARLAGSVQKKVEEFRWRRLQPGYHPAVFRVIGAVRRVDSSAYDPAIVSIGPFHRENLGLRAMEEVKWLYLHDLMARRPPNTNEVSERVEYLHDLMARRPPSTNIQVAIREVNERVEDSRRQYSEKFPDISDEDFVMMMVLDGCFILELMFKQYVDEWDIISAAGRWALQRLLNDLILFENQIPFFILETLFQTMAPPSFPGTFLDLATNFMLSPWMIDRLPPPLPAAPNSQFRHLLHLYHYLQAPHYSEPPLACKCMTASYSLMQVACRMLRRMRKMVVHVALQIFFRLFLLVASCLMCRLPDCPSDNYFDVPCTIPCATKLKEAGVRFKQKDLGEESHASVQKMTFSSTDGVFEIPSMTLHSGSNSQLRNLIAFEQCYHDITVGEYFSYYCLLMSSLIDTDGDVEILEEQKIIFNLLGSRGEVAALFDRVILGARLEQNITQDFKNLMDKVKQYCKSDVHRWRARLMRDYFGNPWAILSLLAAAVLLVITIVQTFYTVYAYYRPR